MLPEFAVAKAAGQKPKDQQRGEQSLDAWIIEMQRCHPLPVHLSRLGEVAEGVFPDPAIAAQSLDVEEMSVGREADLPQSREILESFADLEVAGVIDGGFGAQGAALFVVLLDARLLVVEVH